MSGALTMPASLDPELDHSLAQINTRRRAKSDALGPVTDALVDAESVLEEHYHHSIHLAVYGSLAPGKENHHVLAKYAGQWTSGRVRGDLVNAGWGAAGGFPGLVPRTDGPWVPVQVLASHDLPSAWREIDEFEGDEYRRILIPVYDNVATSRLVVVANIYEIAH
jgi:gamma-glutamylcyclotransferase (GGCT)/AIG2-like uncharacterized protein YtfP